MSEVERIGRPRIGSTKQGPSPLLSTRVDHTTLERFNALSIASRRKPSDLLREAIQLLIDAHSESLATGTASGLAWHQTLPMSLDELRGPSSGTVVRPLSVSTASSSVYNIDNRFDLAALYQLVITEASRDDVVKYLDRELLISNWTRLNLATDVRAAWEARFAELSR